MSGTVEKCRLLTELVWTGVKHCPFNPELCSGNQPRDNCLLEDHVSHREGARRSLDWNEGDEPFAY